MHRSFLTFTASTALLVGIAHGQNASAPVAQPASPAPTVVSAPAPEAQPAPQTPTRVTQTVYSPKLPTPQELTDAAAGQGLTVERITQTANQVIAFYRNSSGQPITVAYQTLPPTGTTVTQPSPAPVVVTAPPTVVYETAPRVIYYDAPYYYPYPHYYYPPVSVSFGFGFRGGYHHHYRR